MTSRRQKTEKRSKSAKARYSVLIDRGLNIFECQKEMDIELTKLLGYSAQLRKIPLLGDVDLYWYLNGHYEYEQEKLKQEKLEEYNKPFKPQNNWWDEL